MNFNDFIKSNNNTKKYSQNDEKKESIKPTTEQIESIVENYKNLSQPELLQELLKQTKNQKARGNLSNEKIDQLISTLRPMLNEEQKNNLDSIKKLLEWVLSDKQKNWPNVV